MRFSFLFIATALLFPLLAQAQNTTTGLPQGQTALNISATESVEIDQDLLVASLRIQHEAEQASDVQKTINETMGKAVALVKQSPDIDLQTGQYYVSPDYRQIRNQETGERTREIEKWRGSQTLILKSKNAEDILKVTGQLQDMDFVMNSLSYQLSPALYQSTRDSLMEDTVQALQKRAERVARALGKQTVDIVEINVDAMPNIPRPVYARAAMMETMAMASDAMAPPSAEAGKDTVSMTINARAILE
jgi:predicted secreted protein